MAEMLDVEIKKSVSVRATPERVYDAFTTTDGLDGSFTEGASIDARPGGFSSSGGGFGDPTR